MTLTVRSHSFKRLLVGLSANSASQSTKLAAELAGLMQLELRGLFLDDSNLHNLAAIPFAREFRPLGAGWRHMHTEQIVQELDLAARKAERTFMQVARQLVKEHRFEILRGPIVETLAALSQTTDIIMITEPVSAAERAAQQFLWLTEAAFQSAAAVMFVPMRIAWHTGPIVAIAAVPDDPSIAVAANIALAAKESLIVVQAYDGNADKALLNDLAAETGLTIRLESCGAACLTAPERCVLALAPIGGERLIVMSRGATAHNVAPTLVAARHVPALVLEPVPTG